MHSTIPRGGRPSGAARQWSAHSEFGDFCLGRKSRVDGSHYVNSEGHRQQIGSKSATTNATSSTRFTAQTHECTGLLDTEP